MEPTLVLSKGEISTLIKSLEFERNEMREERCMYSDEGIESIEKLIDKLIKSEASNDGLQENRSHPS